MNALVDVDDLWCEEQITDLLLPLREGVGQTFRMTAYAIPNKLGPVFSLKAKYPWLTFGIHGFEHTFCECRSWTSDLARAHIETALEMGYDPVFKPPNWIYDIEVAQACANLDVVFHHHVDGYPTFKGLQAYPGPIENRPEDVDFIHTHIQRTAASNVDFIQDNPNFKIAHLKTYTKFFTPAQLAIRIGSNGA